MAVKVARGQVTIIDQNDAVTLQAFIGSSQPLTQVYNKDTNAYAPSWVHRRISFLHLRSL